MKKTFALPVLVFLCVLLAGLSAYAAEYSSAWYQENGNWKVKGPDGQPLKNCWFCDDAVFSNGKNIWYLLDANGNMVASPLVRDRSGNYYSLETEHNGHYGSLRFQNGYYEDIPMTFSANHDGTFGALIKPSAIEALKDIYGVQDISDIDSSNCVYSSSWLGISGTPSASAKSAAGPSGEETAIADDVLRTIRYTKAYKGTLFSDSGHTRTFTVRNLSEQGFMYWVDNMGDRYYPGEQFYFEGNRTGAELMARFEDD